MSREVKLNRSELESRLIDATLEHGLAGEEMRLMRVAWKTGLEEHYGMEAEGQIQRLRHIAGTYIEIATSARPEIASELREWALEELNSARDMADYMSGNADPNLAVVGARLRAEIDLELDRIGLQ